MTIEWLAYPGESSPQRVRRDLGWSDIPEYTRNDVLVQLPLTCNSHEITEDAAIGVMALLIHNLEGAEILSVLRIGSGGDYLLAIRGGTAQMPIECSGIRIDHEGHHSIARIGEKCRQVLSGAYSSGFASVTTFSHGPGADVFSRLRFVSVPPRAGRKRKGKRK